MKQLVFISLLWVAMEASAQKKVVPVTQSVLTGISLPSGTKQDKRFLSETSARLLLEMESKKSGLSIKDIEVLYLPPLVPGGYNDDSLIAALSAIGWNLAPLGADNKYVLLQKDGKSVVVYYEKDNKRETQLYLGLAVTGSTGNTNTGYPSPPGNTYPPQGNNYPPPPPPTQQDNSSNNPPPPSNPINMEQPVGVTPGNNGITISTINFDDGWVSVPMADWVQVAKGDDKVFLHYSIPLPDNLRGGNANDVLNYFWSLLVQPRYSSLSNLEYRQPEPYSYKREYFMEGDGMETLSGRNCHIGLKINIDGGIASFVEIQSASKASLHTHFKTDEAIDIMKWYNRFAISKEDLAGEWQESTGTAANYYNAYSGAYAGMAAVSTSSRLVLGSDGLFTLEEKGAYGMVGNQNFYDQKYAGNYQVTNWEMVTVDKTGKRVVYNAYYEAVKNGRILHLQNQEFKGSQMHLIKAK